MKYFVPLFFGVLFLPLIAFADVKINEVAWMGTANSKYSEWIELYNDGDNAVSLAGWKLYKTGDKVLFTLSKNIAAKGYLLVQRTTGKTSGAFPDINDEAGKFGAGGLNNAGEDLTLKDAQDTVMDRLSFAGGWPAGNVTTKDTMQWNGQQWVTAPGTPDAANATVEHVLPGPDTSKPIPPVGNKKTASKKSSTAKALAATVQAAAAITIRAPKNIFQGVRNEYTASAAVPDALKTSQGYFYWNMGDGGTYIQTVPSPLNYTYHYAGTYTMSVSYFSSPSASQPVLQDVVTVAVIAPEVTLETVSQGAALQITNNTSTSMDIGQWPITTTQGVRSMPLLTVIAANSHSTVTAQSLGLSAIQHPVLSTPDGTILQSVPVKKAVVKAKTKSKSKAKTVKKKVKTKKVKKKVKAARGHVVQGQK
jgi:hypothetical protein